MATDEELDVLPSLTLPEQNALFAHDETFIENFAMPGTPPNLELHHYPDVPALVPAAVSSPSSSSEVGSSGDQQQQPAIDELLQLINWNGKARNGTKRVRGLVSETKEKHNEREQQRRDNYASAMQDLDSIVPKSGAQSKRSKINTLQDAVDYIRRVQEVTLALMEENRRLSTSMMRQPALVDASSSPSPPRTPVAERREVARLLIVGLLLAWFSYGVSLPWLGEQASSFDASSFSSRHILSLFPPSQAPLLSLIYRGFLQVLKVLVAIVVVWLCYLLQGMTRVSAERIDAIKTLTRVAEVAVDRNSNWVVGNTKVQEILHLLDKSWPTTLVGQVLFFTIQLIRALLNVFFVGRWIERPLVVFFQRQWPTILEARLFLYSCCLGPSFPGRARPAWYYGCYLAAGSGFNVANAPAQYTDEFESSLCLFDNDTQHIAPRFVSRLLLWLATARLPPARIGFNSVDENDWTLLRMTKHTRHIRLSDAFAEAMEKTATAKGMLQHREVTTAGVICFAMREDRNAFIILSTALKLVSATSLMPISATRIATCMLIVCLRRLERLQDARNLLPIAERLYVTVPDGLANIMDCEHLFLLTARIFTLDDQDHAGLVGNLRQFSSLCWQRTYGVPFALEAVIERSLSALQLSNELLQKGTTQRTDSETYLLHHRAQLSDSVDGMIQILKSFLPWADWIRPTVERVLGWQAYVQHRRAVASAHLLESIEEANRLGLSAQCEFSRQLMKKMGFEIAQDKDQETNKQTV